MRGSLIVSFALLIAPGCECVAQDFVSASAGVLQYFEGAVKIDDQPVAHKAAVFPSLKNGSTIRTEKGRAELLLGAGAYLRLDENSAVRMVSNSLTDARLEVLDGIAIYENLNANAGDSTVLTNRTSEVRFPKPGVYRIDHDMGELEIYSGEAEVTHHGAISKVDPSHIYYFALELSTSKLGDGAMDEFYDWAHNRSDVIADQNQRASAEQDDSADPDPNAIGGLFGVPPVNSPSYNPPNSLYGSSTFGYGNWIDPNYQYWPTPYYGSPFFPNVLVVFPFHRRPTGVKWPVIAGVNWPTGITRWPRPIQGMGYLPGTTLHYPISGGYRPVGTASSYRPTGTTVPRSSSTTTHAVAAPHVSVGHR